MSEIPQDAAAFLMLATVAGNAPDHHVGEVRCLGPGFTPGPRRWFPVGDYRCAAAYAIARAGNYNVFVGALPRIRRGGGRDDVERSSIVWSDVDQPDAADRLEQFPVPPSIVIATGSPGHLLAIWQLCEPLRADLVKPMNQRIAHALGSDPAATDAARVIRLPGTLNHKHDPARPVVCLSIDPHTYAIGDIVDDLPEPPAPARVISVDASTARRNATPMLADDVLREIPASEYVPALTRQELGRDNKVSCPFHEDSSPSLHAYEGDGGWFCYGCERGGSIIDFGALLYNIEPRAAGFHEIRRRLAADLLRSVAA